MKNAAAVSANHVAEKKQHAQRKPKHLNGYTGVGKLLLISQLRKGARLISRRTGMFDTDIRTASSDESLSPQVSEPPQRARRLKHKEITVISTGGEGARAKRATKIIERN